MQGKRTIYFNIKKKKVNINLKFSRLFHLCVFQIYYCLWWHLSCSNLLPEYLARTWKSTKLKLVCVCVCMCVSVHRCMQITQKDSFLLVSLYSFWCLLWQISVRRDFVCWFICEANCMTLIYCIFLEWPAFCDFLKRSWLRRVKLNESSLALKVYLKLPKALVLSEQY